MPLYIAQVYPDLGSPTVSYSFPDLVLPGRYAVGLCYANIAYNDNNNHNIRRMSLSLDHGQSDDKTIYVTVNASMEDDQGHSIAPLCDFSVTIVAWVGSSDTPTLLMENITGVAPTNSPQIQMPSNAIYVNTFLSGFSVELQAEQGWTSLTAGTSVNFNTITNTATITGGCQFNGVGGTVDVGLIVQTDANAPFKVFSKSGQFTPESGTTSLASAVNSFGINYPGTGIYHWILNYDLGSNSPYQEPQDGPVPYEWGASVVQGASGDGPMGSLNAIVISNATVVIQS
jgi:hypothetical protein